MGRLSIDTLTFNRSDGRGDPWNERVVVRGDDRGAIEAAVRRAASRMLGVSRSGIEVGDREVGTTPNYTSVDSTDDGVVLYVDCKGDVGDRRRSTLRRILREELDSVAGDLSVRPVDEEINSAWELPPGTPEWLRYAAAEIPGYPEDLRTSIGRPVRVEAERFHGNRAVGPSIAGWLARDIRAVDDDPNTTLRLAVEALTGAGATVTAGPGQYDAHDGRPLWLAALRRDHDEVAVIVRELKGLRGKPPYLRKVTERCVLDVSVAQQRPKGPGVG